MTYERNNVNREYKDRLFKLIFRKKEDLFYFADLYRKLMAGVDRDIYSSKQIKLPFPQFVVFYNGTEQQPERQVFHLHSAFPEGMNRENAAIDCHAVMLNINYGKNRELMKKCRGLEEYSIFIRRVRENTECKMPVREAIDCAVEECIKEGILEKILRENREEVCSMLLAEYDEHAHIENEKEIAREEGREEGWQACETLMVRLVEYLQRDGRLRDLQLLSDEKSRKELYREYHLVE